MIEDLYKVKYDAKATVILDDARILDRCMPRSLVSGVDCVITSPPYPNEKDYTRATRLESVILDFVKSKEDLRKIKRAMLRSNSRNIYTTDDGDSHYVQNFGSITSLAKEIEEKRLELNKTSGFERNYQAVVLQYFGGMYRHLRTLKPFLRKDCKLAYVLGDQMSFFRIPIRTAELLGGIAESLNYKVTAIELWRTRMATKTKLKLNENVIILESK